MSQVAQQSFTSNQVAHITGASLKQLQWWDEHGIATAGRLYGRRSSRGVRRAYSVTELAHACVLAHLRRKEIPLQRARVILFALKRTPPELKAHVANGGQLFLMTDGGSVRFEKDAAAVIERMKSVRVGVWLVDVGEIWRKVEGRALGAGGGR